MRLTGDTNPIHQSLPAAQAAGFERCLVPGIMAASLFPALIGSAVPGALYLTQTLKFRAPVQVRAGGWRLGEVTHSTLEAVRTERNVPESQSDQ